MTITGVNFGNDSAACFLELGAVYVTVLAHGWAYSKSFVSAASVVAFSPTSIQFIAPLSAGDVDIYVRMRGICVVSIMRVVRSPQVVIVALPSNMESVKVTVSYEPPVVSGVIGAIGSTEGDNVVAIWGNYLGVWSESEMLFANGPSVTLGGSVCIVTSWAYTNISCRAPVGSGTGKSVVVSVPRRRADGTVSIAKVAAGAVIRYDYSPPRIISVRADPSSNVGVGWHSPTVGGSLVEISGESLGSATAPGISLFVGQKAVLIVSQTHTRIVFVAPPGSGLDNSILYSVDGQSVKVGGFNYLPPVVQSIQCDEDVTNKVASCYAGSFPCKTPRFDANGASLSFLGANFGLQASALVQISLFDAIGRKIACSSPATSGMWVSDSLLRCVAGVLRVGPYGVIIAVANQSLTIPLGDGPYAECREGYFGLVEYDATCFKCPTSVDEFGEVNPNAGVCVGGDAIPVSAAQYWLNSPPGARSLMNFTVELCRPPDACSGNNLCSAGYTGTGCALVSWTCARRVFVMTERLRAVCEEALSSRSAEWSLRTVSERGRPRSDRLFFHLHGGRCTSIQAVSKGAVCCCNGDFGRVFPSSFRIC